MPPEARLPVSAFIICKDEEQYLGNCIESLSDCAEIVIVDSGSTDGTAELVKSYAAAGWPIRFVYEPWRGYAAQKQFALEQCTQPWLLSIDSDERLDEELRDELPRLLGAPDSVAGYRFARRPYLIGFGYTPKSVRERKILRLIRKDRGAFDLTLRVHEGILADGDVLDCEPGSLLHYRPLPVEEQILKENSYSTLKADMLLERGAQARFAKFFLNPPLYFLRLYVRNGLWRCGFPGLIQALTGSVYSFLTEAKIYQRHALKRRPSHDDMEGAPPRTLPIASAPAEPLKKVA
ncbi:putative glycosyltransferase EpsH [Pseudobythopirellula maris]|uniref:Putative glycosyltransferase EpsH n=1 Tax=Pseudobythopirellula maris TaxID=2527991 RepID=A0A5C5ZGZ2_9BACT|nr:glycosyltransferase family 2 protein [Pseudobythopirellula maris]TWT86602.1 putative glycosyltransferase EpsH [Pseudobythopirellula maris]